MPSKSRRPRSSKLRIAPRQYRSLLIEPLEGRLLLTSITVDTASDAVSHVGTSLRDAITRANTDAKAGGSDTITFAPSLNGQTITLVQGQLELGQSGAGSGTITIQGDGNIAISGNQASAVFLVDAGVTAAFSGLAVEEGLGGGINNSGTLTLNNSVVSGNAVDLNSDLYYGGGISNRGILSLSGSTVSDNSGFAGGGIYNVGNLTVTNCSIAGNRVDSSGDGGGVYDAGTATISGSTISANTGLDGGGLFVGGGSLAINDCTISYNLASSGGGISTNGAVLLSIADSTISQNMAGVNGSGGGVDNFDTQTFTLVGSTVSGNTAGVQGGGISNGPYGNTATLSNCTISANQVTGSSSEGGGIYNSETMTLINCTVYGNTAGHGAGGILNTDFLTISSSTISGNSAQVAGGLGDSGGTLTLSSSLVALNTATADPDVDAVVAAGTYNFIGNATGLSGLTNGTGGNQVGTGADPRLGGLADNGGGTQTLALLAGSPAIGAGGAVTALAAGIGAAVTQIVVANAAAIAVTPGSYVIEVDSEQMLVTAVDLDSNTLTVTRGYNGTTEASHAASASVYLATDQTGAPRIQPPDIGAFQYTTSAPRVSGTSTFENVQTTSGLVITPSTVGGAGVTYFEIQNVTGGTLYNGTTLVTDNTFIPLAAGEAGLKFTPNSSANGSFTVLESSTNMASGVVGTPATATILVQVLTTPSVTGATTTVNTQTSDGLLVIKPSAADAPLVTGFQISNVVGGALFLNDGFTSAGSIITEAQGLAGLKFVTVHAPGRSEGAG